MAIENRDINARSIRNMMNVALSNEFVDLNSTALKTKANHLKSVWNKFAANNAQTIRETAEQAERVSHAELYDEIEQVYLNALAIFEERANHLGKMNQQLKEAEAQAEGQINEQGNPTNEQLNEPFHVSENGSANDSLNSIVNEQQQVPLQVQTPNQQVQLQPIYLSCQGSKQLENTWGEFDGRLTHWQGFYDRFKASVHDRTDIADSFKFVHLQSSLKGKAAAALGQWALTDANYKEAFDRLKQLYAQKYHTSKELLDKFYKLPVLERPSGSELQKMSNITHEVLRQLKTMEYPVEHFDLIFVHKLHEKLDPETRKAWELYRKSEFPPISEMLKFIDWQANALVGVQGNVQKDSKENRKRIGQKSDQKPFEKRPKPEHDKSVFNGHNSSEPIKCAICDEPHRVYKCSKFLKMNLSARKKAVRDKNLCHNCFRNSHYSKDCPSNACKRCNIKHNSLLCSGNPLNSAVNFVNMRNNSQKKSKDQTKSE